MSLFGMTGIVPEFLIISIINSSFMSHYVDDFVNNTQTFQINDARQLPIVIPNNKCLSQYKTIFDKAISVKKADNDELKLSNLQNDLDSLTLSLYQLSQ